MVRKCQNQFTTKKKSRSIDREVNTPLLILRACQLGISMDALEMITFGMLIDILTENSNDSYEYDELATQEDVDNF